MPWIDKDTYELPRWIGVPIGWIIFLTPWILLLLLCNLITYA